jgi:hypothetical protein
MTARRFLKMVTIAALCVCTVMAFQSMGAQPAVRPDGDQAGYTCTVTRASAGWNNSYVKLTNVKGNPGFALKWFRLPDGQAEEMMVTAAEAMHTGQTLFVEVDIHDGIFPQVETLQLEQEKNTNVAGEKRGFLRICRLVRAKSNAILHL